MHFKINKEILLQNLLITQRGIPVKTALPVLTCFKFEVEEKQIAITASNSNIVIQTIIKDPSLQVKRPGTAAIPGKFLADIVRKLDCETVEFETQNNQSVRILAGSSEFNLRLMDVLDYPTINLIEDRGLDVQTQRLQSIVRQTAFSASDDEKNQILNGVNVYNKSKQVIVVATNGYRLSQRKILTKGDMGDFQVIIPKTSLDELSKILDTVNTENVEVSFSKTHALFKFLNISFQTRLFEGRYPQTETLIPNEFLVEIPFNKGDLISTLDRVSLFSPKEKDGYNVITLTLKKDKTVLIESANTEIGEASEQIIPNGQVLGDSISISFSARYLIDALKSFLSQDIIIKFINDKKAFVLNGLQDENLTQLILPIHRR